MPDPVDVDREAQALADVRALAADDVRAIWTDLDLDDLAAARDDLELALPAVVDHHAELAVTVTNDAYLRQRRAAGVTTPFAPLRPDPFDRDRLGSSVRWSLGPAFADRDHDAALARLAEVTDSAIMAQSDAAKTVNADADPANPRRAFRPEPKACGFCRMLASRGAVYKSATIRRPHGKCHCDLILVFPGEDLPYDVDAYRRQYDEARREAGSGRPNQIAQVLDRYPPPPPPRIGPLPIRRGEARDLRRVAAGERWNVSAAQIKAFEQDARAVRTHIVRAATEAQRAEAQWFATNDAWRLRSPGRGYAGGEYDWLKPLHASERTRLRTRWMRAQGNVSHVDVVQTGASEQAQRLTVDEFSEEWLEHTRRYDALGALRKGQIPDPARMGGVDAPALIEDELADRLGGPIDLERVLQVDLEDAAGYLAQRANRQVADEALRALGDAAHSPLPPWRMSFQAWETELRLLEEVRDATPDAWTRELASRYDELVPRYIDDGQDYEDLYAQVVETARVAELDVSEIAVIPWA